jgi:D-ribulokinase
MPRESALYLGLDVGTSGVRGVCIGDDLAIVASARTTTSIKDRGILRSPQSWKQMLEIILADLGRQADLVKVTSIATAGQSGTVLVCDAGGQPFGDSALLYSDIPEHSTSAALKKRHQLNAPTLGRAHDLWLNAGRPEKFHVVHQADWVAGLFSGRFDRSDENNALKTGYDPAARKWSFDANILPFSKSALPVIVPPATWIGNAATNFAQKFGFCGQCQVHTGTTDGMAGFIAASGLNRLEPGVAVTSLGTTLVIKSLSARAINVAEYGIYSHRLFDFWVAGGASNSGGGALLAHFSTQELAELSKCIDFTDISQLDYYPLVAKGDRFPVNDPDLVSRTLPRPADDAEFLAGLFASIARIEKRGYEVLDRYGAPYPRLVKTVGGGSANNVWTEIRQRVLGVKVVSADQTEAAYGAALIARYGGTRA